MMQHLFHLSVFGFFIGQCFGGFSPRLDETPVSRPAPRLTSFVESARYTAQNLLWDLGYPLVEEARNRFERPLQRKI